MKKYYSLIFVILIAFAICSCTQGGSNSNVEISPPNENSSNGGSNLSIEISPSDKSLIDLATKTYDEAELLELLEFDGSLNELNISYPIECLRKGNELYQVSYLGNDSVAIFVFDSSGNKLMGNIHRTTLFKSDFDGVAVGQSLDEVRAFDPNGEYIFLYTGSGTPRVSSHYTKDGYCITIEYDVSNTIISINKGLI